MAEDPKPWPRDPISGAQLITAYAHGLLTGPCGVAFMRQSALGPGADLNAKALMDTAEALAGEAMARSYTRTCQGTPADLAALFHRPARPAPPRPLE